MPVFARNYVAYYRISSKFSLFLRLGVDADADVVLIMRSVGPRDRQLTNPNHSINPLTAEP